MEGGGHDCNRTSLQGAALREGEREGMRQGKAEFRRWGSFTGPREGGVWNTVLVPASLARMKYEVQHVELVR